MGGSGDDVGGRIALAAWDTSSLKFFVQARGEARALIVSVLLGASAGLAAGGAYLAGGLAHAANDHARQVRMADAAQSGFSAQSLQLRTTRMDPSVLAIAEQHDPYALGGAAERDRLTALVAARLERSSGAGLIRASLSFGAEPYRFEGALEQSRDLECLTAAVYYEARGEGEAGMQAVAQVVLNRARHPLFPHSVCGVVYQGAAQRTCQFSFTCDGSMRRSREPGAWERSRRVAARALGGFVMASVGNATHFHTTGVAPGWRGMLRVSQVGSHIFYRFAGRNGSSSAFTIRPDTSTASDVQVASARPSPAAPAAPVNEAADTETFLAGDDETAPAAAAESADASAQPTSAQVSEPAVQRTETTAS
jgi:hypothetical protein